VSKAAQWAAFFLEVDTVRTRRKRLGRMIDEELCFFALFSLMTLIFRRGIM
jgi:hypothetical protein